MATYKVIQDIEAEDKLVGPLTFKGFIYALVAVFLGFINFRLIVATGLGSFRWVFILILSLPMLLFVLLASPLGRDQPTEVWLLSHIRFFLKPKKRIWDQSGISELVTITVPKKIERRLTKGLSESEVDSRLRALAMTLDSRGWAVKNVNVNLGGIPGYLEKVEANSDRLVDTSALPQPVPVVDIQASDDIMDEQNNPIARYFKGLIQHKDDERKKAMLDRVNLAQNEATAKQDKAGPRFASGQSAWSGIQRSPANGDKDDELGDSRLRDQHPHFKPALSLAEERRQAKKAGKKNQTSKVTAPDQAANMELAQSGNDLSVASIQHLADRKNQANRKNQIEEIGPGEGVISLH